MATTQATRFAAREVRGVDDAGRPETITISIDWCAGGSWRVCRVVNAHQRDCATALHRDELVFEGYEMVDALEAANDALASDLEVSRADGRAQDVPAFREPELRSKLERWFFDHR
jgi:hypothetical protein